MPTIAAELSRALRLLARCRETALIAGELEAARTMDKAMRRIRKARAVLGECTRQDKADDAE